MLRELVIRSILDGVPDREPEAHIRAVYDWTKAYLRYISDPLPMDLYPTAMNVVGVGGGDCDCHVIFSMAALSQIGFRTGCRVIESQEGIWHVYGLVWLDSADLSNPIPFDTTWDGSRAPGDEYGLEKCLYRNSWVFDI